MFDRFGEFGSAEEINMTAEGLKAEGDFESLKNLCKENGIDLEMANLYMQNAVPIICDDMGAALGKLEIEAGELKPEQIMEDWVEYIKARCIEDNNVSKQVRQKGKTLKGCIAALLSWSFSHQIPIDKEIIKEAKIKAGKVTLGIPGMGQAKKIISKYYGG